MPRVQPRWAYSFTASDKLRDAERGKDEGGEPCSRGDFCAGKRVEIRDGERVICPALTYTAFCVADRGIIASCLSLMPDLTRRLCRAIADHIVGEILIRIPFGPSVPLRLDVDAVLRMITERLAGWEEVTRTTARDSETDTEVTRRRGMRDPAGQVRESAGELARRLDVLFAIREAPMDRWLPLPKPLADLKPDSVSGDRAVVLLTGADAGNEILWMEWLGRAVLQETPPRIERLLGVPCRSCELRALRRADPPLHDGDPVYWSACQNCRDLMLREDYDDWVKRNAAFYRHSAERPVLAALPGVA
jgi:hypothetical protein